MTVIKRDEREHFLGMTNRHSYSPCISLLSRRVASSDVENNQIHLKLKVRARFKSVDRYTSSMGVAWGVASLQLQQETQK